MNSDAVSTMLALTLGSGVALIFLRALYHKVSEFTEFTGFVADYRILPEALVRPASYGLVIAEGAVVLGTVVPGGLRYAMVLGAGLFLLYAAAIGINVSRGRTTVECGCGGAPQAVGPALLWRNGILAAVALLAAALPSGGLPALSVVAALAAGILLWVAFLMADLLLSNASLARRSL
ncbi:MauE/DoxX family redox-associated membrane protein [Pseudoroseicyclus sp. H15]